MSTTSGHRQRLKERILAGEALLELLLTYALPQHDTQPLARDLLARDLLLSSVPALAVI